MTSLCSVTHANSYHLTISQCCISMIMIRTATLSARTKRGKKFKPTTVSYRSDDGEQTIDSHPYKGDYTRRSRMRQGLVFIKFCIAKYRSPLELSDKEIL